MLTSVVIWLPVGSVPTALEICRLTLCHDRVSVMPDACLAPSSAARRLISGRARDGCVSLWAPLMARCVQCGMRGGDDAAAAAGCVGSRLLRGP